MNHPTFVSHVIVLAANPVNLLCQLVTKPNDEYIAAGDEVVFGKAGKETYGIGRFFFSMQNRVISGLLCSGAFISTCLIITYLPNSRLFPENLRSNSLYEKEIKWEK